MVKNKKIKDPSLRELVDITIEDMGKCYGTKDIDMMLEVGWRFGKYLTLYKLKYPSREEEAFAAECEVRCYSVFQK